MTLRLSSASLVLATMLAALGGYTVNLKVSGERAQVEQLEREIARDLREIRQLEAELRTRASLPQMQRWNDEVLALVPAQASQYAGSAVQLAAYAPQQPAIPAMERAPVQLAAAEIPDAVQPAATPAVAAVVRERAPARVAVASVVAPVRTAPVAPVRVAAALGDKARKADAMVRTVAAEAPRGVKVVKVAAQTGGLLSDNFAAELEAAATAERAGFRKVSLQ